jgi:hypothetical protein
MNEVALIVVAPVRPLDVLGGQTGAAERAPEQKRGQRGKDLPYLGDESYSERSHRFSLSDWLGA